MPQFYVGAMNASVTLAHDGANVSARCFLWAGAALDACFVERPPDATRGAFRVATFEAMLRATQDEIVGPNPNCGRDKWADHHYGFDRPSMNGDYILDYLKVRKGRRDESGATGARAVGASGASRQHPHRKEERGSASRSVESSGPRRAPQDPRRKTNQRCSSHNTTKEWIIIRR